MDAASFKIRRKDVGIDVSTAATVSGDPSAHWCSTCTAPSGGGGGGSGGGVANTSTSTDVAEHGAAGENLIQDRTAKVLGVAFLSIAQSVTQMEKSVRKMEKRMDNAEQMMGEIATKLSEQGKRVAALDCRMRQLEQQMLVQPPAGQPPGVQRVSSMARIGRPSGSGYRLGPSRSYPTRPMACAPPGTSESSAGGVAGARAGSGLAGRRCRCGHGFTLPPPRSVSCNTSARMQLTRSCCAARYANMGRQLLKAAHEGSGKEVRQLLDEGTDPNFPNSSKWTPLHRAAAKAHSDIVELLLKRGADVNAKTSYGFTPLHTAACNDFTGACVRQLIAAKSLLDQQDRSQRTALHYAAAYGNEKAVSALLEAGADRTVKDDEGWTPLDVARVHSIKVLLDDAVE